VTRRDALMRDSLAPATRKSYEHACSLFSAFAKNHGLPAAPPIPSEVLSLWLTKVQPSVAAGSLRVYASAIGTWHELEGLPSPSADPVIRRLLKGAARRAPLPDPDKRLPFTPATLQAVKPFLSSAQDDVVWLAAASCALFALLRLGELFPENKPFSWAQLSVETTAKATIVRLFLPRSKADSSGEGVFARSSHPDLLDAITRLKSRVPSGPADPVFVLASGHLLTRRAFVDRTRSLLASAGLAADNFSGHSFRRGGATALREAGVSDSDIQLLGRWKSSAFTRYLHASSSRVHAASSRM
jgi:hypothetical protein